MWRRLAGCADFRVIWIAGEAVEVVARNAFLAEALSHCFNVARGIRALATDVIDTTSNSVLISTAWQHATRAGTRGACGAVRVEERCIGCWIDAVPIGGTATTSLAGSMTWSADTSSVGVTPIGAFRGAR